MENPMCMEWLAPRSFKQSYPLIHTEQGARMVNAYTSESSAPGENSLCT